MAKHQYSRRDFMRLAGVGGVVSTVAPAAHDQLLAYLSHLPQLAVSALATGPDA